MKTSAPAAGRVADAAFFERTLDASSLVGRLLAVDARVAAAAGAVLVLFIGVLLSAALNIWVDEAFTLRTTGAGMVEAWTRAIGFEAQPPLYFVLEAGWRNLNESSIAFARLPSVFFTAAAVAVMVFAAGRIAPRVPPLAVALVTAFNPFVLWAAVEMRVYALVLLVGAGLAWTFYEGFLAEVPSQRARLWYVGLAIAGLYTQYYVGFLLVAQGLTLLASRRSAVPVFALATVVIAAAFAPFLPVALVHSRASGGFVEHVTVMRALRQIADAVFIVVFPHDERWFGAVKIAGFGLAALLLIVLGAIGRPAPPRGPASAFVAQWLVCLAIFGALFATAGMPLYPLKYLIVAAPSTLLAGFLFVSSLTRMPLIGGATAAAVYALFTVVALGTQYRPPLEKPGDWQRVAATVSGGGGSIPVAVFPAELAQALMWYLPAPTIAIPGPMPFTLDYVRAMALTDAPEVALTLDPVHAQSRWLWLVTTNDCSDPAPAIYNYHCGYLEAYMKSRYRVVRSVAFRGSLARLYARVPN